MFGKSALIKTGHWALECNIDADCRAFRIDNDYFSDRPALFVVKIAFLPGEELVSVWLDPSLDPEARLPEANLIVNVPDFRFDKLGIYSRSSTDFDEIRLGASFEAITPTQPQKYLQ